MRGITLIGMPGSGKSTIGKKLAERLGYNFVDLDILIKEKTGHGHDHLLKKNGESALLNMEENLTLGLDLENTVFSPGGSIVYSPEAMEKICRETAVIYLELPLQEIRKRLAHTLETRGIVGLKERGIDGLFAERTPLYQKSAHKTIACPNLKDEQIIDIILTFLRT